MNNEVIVLFGAGSIGEAIVRRVSAGRKLLLADYNENKLTEMKQHLTEAGFVVETIKADLSSRESIKEVVAKAQSLGDIMGLVNAAGVSPSQASPEQVLRVNLYGTSVLLEEFGKVMAPGGAGIVISSQSGHRLPALSLEDNHALAMTPTEELLNLSILQPDVIKDSLVAYQYAKRTNVLRVAAESVKWQKRGARINAISPGIIMTPLAIDELNGPRGAGYKQMFDSMVTKRPGTPDEIANLAELLMDRRGAFITGSDFLADGGITAQYWYGNVSEVRNSGAQK
ncbi:short chain dehydrogenase [Companilactobacillus paralimentarius DSM 13238 = JCM 10415]|uniref:Short chain dehydrogenase n=1 Tax=Companilactobacillus paralimentarius DSM 13238 = JCM 10415 TaxID=1122151 RepID=A0A0R1PA52_9LACO|nr:SDR family oxidoreductase [Companilactobacillus paralimentarius]KAE9565211.1 short-chain dehydrogenase [Companilactobacillus paralimentarius]KRL29341.1 short chain dehydrogenase [Companilactobacillus paralimentarius DSM 13238 = JCM 10415]MDR4932576.1 SDR family oxidoreductase [Companilactobacillus paralimentarius]QFR69165.1 SDR family oxidoreductase [Companilactobacillus paralimentarius]